jgi:alkanesulfonate monooxygenase SsuD/methylene tetrahydromethanopterin reductase-like flavin-dependent oxidoreductase (luciferase family)
LDARRSVATFLGRTYDQDFGPMLDHVAVAGTVDEVAEGLQAFIDAGPVTWCACRAAPMP